jgi:hypothetical protein
LLLRLRLLSAWLATALVLLCRLDFGLASLRDGLGGFVGRISLPVTVFPFGKYLKLIFQVLLLHKNRLAFYKPQTGFISDIQSIRRHPGSWRRRSPRQQKRGDARDI